MKETNTTVLGSAVVAVLVAVLGSLLTHASVNRQIMDEQRTEMAVESLSDYFDAIAKSDYGARASAVIRVSVFLDSRSLEALEKFESGVRDGHDFRTEEGRQAFVILFQALRQQLRTGYVDADIFHSILFTHQPATARSRGTRLGHAAAWSQGTELHSGVLAGDFLDRRERGS